MENIAQPNKENKPPLKRLEKLINKHFFDIMAILIIILTITALLGLWRLKQITPSKEPIKIENIPHR